MGNYIGKIQFFSFGSRKPHPCTDQGEIWRGGAVPNFTLIGATCRPCGAKNPQNRLVSKSNSGRAALQADPVGINTDKKLK